MFIYVVRSHSLSQYNTIDNNVSLLKLKNQKKLMDKDSISLANRISMLQTEESRIMKKIENTRRRAEQILEIKKHNEERYIAIMKAEQEKE